MSTSLSLGAPDAVFAQHTDEASPPACEVLDLDTPSPWRTPRARPSTSSGLGSEGSALGFGSCESSVVSLEVGNGQVRQRDPVSAANCHHQGHLTLRVKHVLLLPGEWTLHAPHNDVSLHATEAVLSTRVGSTRNQLKTELHNFPSSCFGFWFESIIITTVIQHPQFHYPSPLNFIFHQSSNIQTNMYDHLPDQPSYLITIVHNRYSMMHLP